MEDKSSVMKHHVFLSLGSNINRKLNISRCLNSLRETFGEIDCSPVYESEPVGFEGEYFYNLVVKISTTLSLDELSSCLKSIEDKHGRIRGGEKFSSRTLDIDVLTYDDLCGIHYGIELPRPEIFYNAFVLLPMAALAADEIEPKTQHTYAELWLEKKADILKKQTLWKVDVELSDAI